MSLLRRLARFALVALAALALALGSCYVAITRPIDRAPIEGSPAAVESERLLDAEGAAFAARQADRGPLQAGWAREKITPPLGTPTLGYGNRLGRGISRVGDDVWVRALALRAGEGATPLVFLSADLCLWLGSLSGRVVEAVGDALPRERLYFGATHTHNGPSGFTDAPAIRFCYGPYDEKLCAMIADRAASAVRAALADLAPSELREAAAPVPEFITNRMRPEEPVDDELYLLELRKRAGGRRAALVVYQAHATAIDHSFAEAGSGDYPGALCRELEARGWDGALFLAGPTAQAGPVCEGKVAYHPGTEVAWRMGRLLAERVAAIAGAAPADGFRGEGEVAVFRSELRLPPMQVPVFGRALTPGWAAWALGEGATAPRAFVHAVRMGGTLLLGHSFEFSSVLSKELKARARAAGRRLVLTSFNGDHNMYVIPDSYYDDGRYESGVTFFGPHLGSWLARLTERAVRATAPGAGR